MSKNFFNKYGDLNPNSWDEMSENPTTFNVAWFFTSVLVGNPRHQQRLNDTWHLIMDKYYTNNSSWRTNNYDPQPDWSLDEKISALAFFSYVKDDEFLRNIPTIARCKNDSFWSWLRPDVLAYTLGSKYKWTRPLMWIIIKYKIRISLKEFEKNPQGESSGVQLAFIKSVGWGKSVVPYKILKQAMDIYYPEDDHPIRELLK